VDLWLNRLKWPVAFLAVLWTPLLCWAWVLLGYRIAGQPFSSLFFGAGFVLFFMAWKSILRYRSVWRWLMRAEHEATHLLFAALTAHPIIGWRDHLHQRRETSESSKESVHFIGEGNWLIQVAPYFFPTAAGILWFTALFIPLGFLGWTTIALGFATGFHVTSTILEIRADRDELGHLRWRFCWMFLPAANLLLLGCLLTFAQEGFSGIFHFLSDSWQPIRQLIQLFQWQSPSD